jgi:acyl-CoA thioesterase FadM
MFILMRYRGDFNIFATQETQHLVWPNDIDLLMHMNNGRYFTLMDIVRIKMLIQAGVWQEMKKRKIYAVIAGETVQFRRPISLFQRYKVSTRMLGWDQKFFYVEHKFKRKQAVCALMIIKIMIMGDQGERPRPSDILKFVLPPDQVAEQQMADVIKIWNQSSARHWKERN